MTALVAAIIAGAALACFVLACLCRRKLAVEDENAYRLAHDSKGPIANRSRFLLLRRTRKSRADARSRQIADVLPLAAEMLRGGSSPENAFATVAASANWPLGEELLQVAREVSSANRTLAQALGSLAQRTQDPDLDLLASAVAVQKEGGGNLAGILDSLAENAQKRSEMKGHLDAITSSARMSAALVGPMPPAMLALLSIASPAYLEDFWASGLWAPILLVVAVLDISGLALIKRLYRLDFS